MNSHILCDCHMHTNRSLDGKNTEQEMVGRAAELGIPVIALTDHCEINDFYSTGYCSLAPMAWQAASDQQKLRKGASPEVLVGIEIGQASTNFELAERVLAAREYDFVLASVHNLLHTPDFYYLSYTEENADFLMEHYFKELLHVVQWGNFDSLAHLTYPLRYITGEFGIQIDLAQYAGQIDEILSLLAQKGKALEINTSGLRQKIGMTLPHFELVKRFRQLGGRHITVGADAHCVADVGKGIPEGIEVAKQAGFDAVTVFRRRCPYEIKI